MLSDCHTRFKYQISIVWKAADFELDVLYPAHGSGRTAAKEGLSCTVGFLSEEENIPRVEEGPGLFKYLRASFKQADRRLDGGTNAKLAAWGIRIVEFYGAHDQRMFVYPISQFSWQPQKSADRLEGS